MASETSPADIINKNDKKESDFSIDYKDLSSFVKLGEGSFGKVSRADYLGTDVAVKECFREISSNDQYLPPGWDFQKYLLREVETLKEARHPNIVQFMGACMNDGKYFIVTEYVPGGNLKEWLREEQASDLSRPLAQLKSIRKRLGFGTDIARALAFLHAHSIIHRDLKLENLLLTENFRVKVCDFGFSRIIQPISTSRHDRKLSYCGTEDYMAPELILCMDYDKTIDIFSFGIVLLSLVLLVQPNHRMFTRSVPGFGLDFDKVKEEIPELFPSKDKFLALAQGCLEEEGKKRWSWKDILATLKELESVYLEKIRESEPKMNASTSMLNIGVSLQQVSEFRGSTASLNDSPPSSNLGSMSSGLTPSTVTPTPESSGYSIGPSAAIPSGSTTTGTLAFLPHQPRKPKGDPHRFSIVSTPINILHPLRCSQCHKNITGFMHSHLQCDDCGITCHKKCGKFVAPTCEAKSEQHANYSNITKSTLAPYQPAQTSPLASASTSPTRKKFEKNLLSVE